MSIDIDEIVRMAGEFQEWSLDNDNGTDFRRLDVIDLADIPHQGLIIAQGVSDELGQWLVNAPATILALSERVAALEAQNAALQAENKRLEGIRSNLNDLLERRLNGDWS